MCIEKENKIFFNFGTSLMGTHFFGRFNNTKFISFKYNYILTSRFLNTTKWNFDDWKEKSKCFFIDFEPVFGEMMTYLTWKKLYGLNGETKQVHSVILVKVKVMYG